ncbi:MAG: hypothetical protein ACLUUO_05290 [Sellimonas intestinalis]
MENELAKLSARVEAAKTKKAETISQLENARLGTKALYLEEELKEKTDRLNALNIELNLDKKTLCHRHRAGAGRRTTRKKEQGYGTATPFAHLYCGNLGIIIRCR